MNLFHVLIIFRFSGKILAVLVNGLTDRNAAIRRQYASAIGHLVSTAKESSLEKLFTKLTTWYFEREGESNCNLFLFSFDQYLLCFRRFNKVGVCLHDSVNRNS